MSDLATRHCKPCEGGTPPLTAEQARALRAQVPQWTLSDDAKAVERKFRFKNYYETLAFVNAVAFIAHREDHHPDLQVSYDTCSVRYSTHAVDGLSDNDFISAAKVDALTDAA